MNSDYRSLAPEELMLKVRGNGNGSSDHVALEEIYRRYSPKLMGYLRNRFRSLGYEDRRDVAGMTLITIWEDKNQYDGRSFIEWLYGITRNKARNQIRANQTESRNLESSASWFDENGYQDHLDMMIKRELADAARRAINNLPDEYRPTAQLRFLYDRSYEEIVDQLGIPKGTVMSKLHRSRRFIRREVRESIGEFV